VEEQSNQSESSTTYVSDADWGHGATVASEQGYSWADATVDSVKTIESYFNPAVGTYFTAKDIVNYWDRASNDSDANDGIDVTWTRYQRMPHTGQYIKYRHYFPPKSEYPGEYVDINTTNTLKIHSMSRTERSTPQEIIKIHSPTAFSSKKVLNQCRWKRDRSREL
jgi:hypothetical protein